MALSQIAFDFFEEPSLPQKKEEKKPLPKKVNPKPILLYTEVKQKSTRGRMSIKDMEATVDLIDVPADEELFTKSYYTIGKVATMFKVNQSLIRFWENEFDILKPRKNRKGDRFFRPDDVKNLKLIYFLLKERKYTISGAKSFIKSGKKVNERFEAIESLKNIRSMLLELKAGLS